LVATLTARAPASLRASYSAASLSSQQPENSLTGQAFNNGLTLASNNANANNAAHSLQPRTRPTLATRALNAGTGAVGGAISGQGSLYGLGENAGQGLTAAQQANLTNQQQQYQAGINNPYASLCPTCSSSARRCTAATAPAPPPQQSNPGALGIIGGLLGAAGGAASGLGDLGWKPFGK
jgi:hypothetical protein